MNSLFIIAHAPLAHALRECVLHVFPDAGQTVIALDVQPNMPPEESLAAARIMLSQLKTPHTLVLTDVFGATPSNVALKLVDGLKTKLVAGVNLPMLLRCVGHCSEPLDVLAARAVAGGTQGVMQVAVTAPQNQPRRHHDQDLHDHQQ
jgi:PTS system ascorbate-specific IIA component